jgi:hypothetical protein
LTVVLELFGQTHGLEGRAAVDVAGFHSNDATITNGPNRGKGPFDLNAAALPLADRTADDHDTIASIDELKLFGAEFLPHLVHVSEHPSNALDPDVGSGIEHASSRVDDDLGMGKIECSLSIAANPCCKSASHYLDVLLRHRSLSIPPFVYAEGEVLY